MSAGRNLIEWKSRRRDSAVVAGTKLVLHSAAERDELDRFDLFIGKIRNNQ